MNDQAFAMFNGQPEKLLAPSRAYNKLAIDKLEQLVSFQLASLHDYAHLNLGQLKAASEISSPEDFKEYLGGQKDFLKTVVEKIASDTQAIVAIGKEFAEEAQRIGR